MSKLVVIIRQDELTGVQQGVQAGHAVAAWLLRYPADWLNNKLVYTQVETEDDLLFYANLFDAQDIKYVLYRDYDLGEKYTALATADPLAHRYTRRISLWRQREPLCFSG